MEELPHAGGIEEVAIRSSAHAIASLRPA